MSFNSDPLKQIQEAMFSQKVNKAFYLPLVVDNSNLIQVNYQKHLEIILNSRLTFDPASTQRCDNIRFLVVFWL